MLREYTIKDGMLSRDARAGVKPVLRVPELDNSLHSSFNSLYVQKA